MTTYFVHSHQNVHPIVNATLIISLPTSCSLLLSSLSMSTMSSIPAAKWYIFHPLIFCRTYLQQITTVKENCQILSSFG